MVAPTNSGCQDLFRHQVSRTEGLPSRVGVVPHLPVLAGDRCWRSSIVLSDFPLMTRCSCVQGKAVCPTDCKCVVMWILCIGVDECWKTSNLCTCIEADICLESGRL